MTERQWVRSTYAVDDDVVIDDAGIRRNKNRGAHANSVSKMHMLGEDCAAEVAHIVADVPSLGQ